MLTPSHALSQLFNEVHLAVVSGNEQQTNQLFNLSRGEFHGTAFALADEVFITALHVYRDARANGINVAIGQIMTQRKQVNLVTEADEFPDIDLVLLKCPGLHVRRLHFDFSPLDYLSEVAACGFAFGVTLSPDGRHTQILRSFKGHIVTRRGLTELSSIAPAGYETSFVPPPGLSGAPLLTFGSKVSVRGVILREHIAEVPHAPERKMTLGTALDIEELLALESRITGGSVAEKIFSRNRIPSRDGTP